MKRVSIIILLILMAVWSFNSAAAHSERVQRADRDLVREGIGLFASHDYAGAVRRFEEALRHNMFDADLHVYAGSAYAEMGRYREAAEHYRRAVEVRPDYLNAQINLCGVYTKSCNLGEGLVACQKASEMDPRSYTTLNNYGWNQFQLGRYSEAKKTFQRLIALRSNDCRRPPKSRRVRMLPCSTVPEAIESALQAIQFQANYLEAWQSLGLYYNQVGSYRQGIEALEKGSANQTRQC